LKEMLEPHLNDLCRPMRSLRLSLGSQNSGGSGGNDDGAPCMDADEVGEPAHVHVEAKEGELQADNHPTSDENLNLASEVDDITTEEA
jgi:hypothetical protein